MCDEKCSTGTLRMVQKLLMLGGLLLEVECQ